MGLKVHTDKILVICGPTATGKTQVGLKVADLLPGEIVSADARHIYKGLDILTGKDIPKDFLYQISDLKADNRQIGYYGNKTRLWLIDYAEQNDVFNVYKYQQAASTVIEDIWIRGKLPIIVGGTGFYIASLVGSVSSLSVPPDLKLRSELEHARIDELQHLLIQIDQKHFAALNSSDSKNPRRLIRAIEHANLAESKTVADNFRDRDILKIGLRAPLEFIEKAIKKRIEKRLDTGVLNEVRGALPNFGNHIPSESAIGLEIVVNVLRGKITLSEAKQQWFIKERQYVKRQLTWFARDKSINWYDISKKGAFADMTGRIAAWYTRSYASKDRNIS